jgi:hypothetical protein
MPPPSGAPSKPKIALPSPEKPSLSFTTALWNSKVKEKMTFDDEPRSQYAALIWTTRLSTRAIAPDHYQSAGGMRHLLVIK